MHVFCFLFVCLLAFYSPVFSALEHVSHGKALKKYAHYYHYYYRDWVRYEFDLQLPSQIGSTYICSSWPDPAIRLYVAGV